MEAIKNQIETILTNKLPNFAIKVIERKEYFGNGTYLATIHNVTNQFPDLCSLRLDNDLTLETQCYGGCGGGSLYRNIDKNNADERFLAMKSVKVPFRKPQQTEKAVLNAISKFADNYLKTLKDIQSMGLLRYTDLVDYSKLLNN